MKETLHLDPSVPEGTCCACRMVPVGEHLEMTVDVQGQIYDVTICRHCLAEHAPYTLMLLEEAERR